VDNVEFLKGRIEEIPLAASWFDVVIYNFDLQLGDQFSTNKAKVLREVARVLRTGGRFARQ